MNLRKGLFLCVTIVSVLILSACVPSNTNPPTHVVDEAAASHQVDTTTTEDLDLPTEVTVNELQVSISWTSSHPQYITTTGVVSRPTAQVGDVDVTLTAVFSYDGKTASKTFTVRVISLDEVTYSVTFMSNGETISTTNVIDGNKVSAPVEPTGSPFFSFGGWYKDANFNTMWQFSTDVVTANVTLYAKWIEAEKHEVTFDADNGSDESTLLVYMNSTLPEQETPLKLGYSFKHWATEDDVVWNFSTDTVTEPITLKAIYEVTEYTITYVYPLEATLVLEGTLSYTILDEISTFSVVSMAHNDFVGWFNAPTDGQEVTTYPVGTTGNITLYARFEEHESYTITFVDPKGSNQSQTKYLGETADMLAAPTHLGYEFLGWFLLLTDLLPFDFLTPITADITLQAKYQPTAYSITYFNTTPVEGWPMTYSIESMDITLPSALKEAYTFIGWFDAALGGNQITTITAGSTGNIDLYARFDVNTYTIDYQLDGGILEGTNPTTYQVVTPTITLLNPSKEGYAFVGWFTDQIEGVQVTEITLGSFGDIDLYARFSLILSIDYYGYLNVEIEDVKTSTYWPETAIALANGTVYTRGNGEYGLIGNGSYENLENWTNINAYFNLAEGDYIVEIALVEKQAIARSNLGQLYVWGFISQDGMAIYSNSPIHVNSLVEPNIGEVLHFRPLHFGFLFETSQSIYRYYNNIVTDITPNLNGETMTWAPLFGMTMLPQSLAFTTESSIYLYDYYLTQTFVNITNDLNLPEENILMVLSQDNALHIILETSYYYAMYTEDENNPLVLMNVPLTISLNEGEFILSMFAAGGLFTSEHRILVPQYIMDEMTEMPLQVNYIDITPEIELQPGEAISKVHAPIFIETTLGRLLLIDMNEGDSLQTIQVFDTLLPTLLEEDEYIVEFRSVGWDLYVVTNLKMAAIEFGESGIILHHVQINTIGLIHQQEIPAHLYEDNTYIPDNPLYQAFDGWYMDSELTIPFTYDLVEAEFSLYASFVPTHYFITIEDYQGGEPTVLAVPFDETPTEPTLPPMEHQMFTGWHYYDNDMHYQYDFSYPINKNVMLYANYTQKEYEVTYWFEGFDPIVTTEYALSYYSDFDFVSPEGYEIIAIYLDSDMLIPFDPELLLEGPISLYVAIDPMVIEVYYYQDLEDITFVKLYPIGNQVFGMTDDNRIYAWGDNYQGALGIGMEHILNVSMPLDITHLFNLNIGETITEIDGLYSIKVALSSEGRAYVWGYYKYNGEVQSLIKDITPLLNLPFGSSIVDVHASYSGIYFYLNDGKIIYFDFYSESTKVMETGLLLDVIYSEQLEYNPDELFLITTQGVYIVEYLSESESTNVMDLTTSLGTDVVFTTKVNYQAFGQLYLYTTQGRIYVFDNIAQTITFVDDLNLNPMESLENMFIIAWDTLAFTTSENRLLTYNGDLITDIDVSLLGEEEKILTFEYGQFFYTSKARAFVIDTNTSSLIGGTNLFTLDELDYITRFITVNWMLHAELNSMTYVHVSGVELVKTVGTNLTIDVYQFGTTFVLFDIAPKPGYTFNGWVDMDGNLYVETPANPVFLYPSFTPNE